MVANWPKSHLVSNIPEGLEPVSQNECRKLTENNLRRNRSSRNRGPFNFSYISRDITITLRRGNMTGGEWATGSGFPPRAVVTEWKDLDTVELKWKKGWLMIEISLQIWYRWNWIWRYTHIWQRNETRMSQRKWCWCGCCRSGFPCPNENPRTWDQVSTQSILCSSSTIYRVK